MERLRSLVALCCLTEVRCGCAGGRRSDNALRMTSEQKCVFSFPPREPPDSLSSLKPVHDTKPEGGAESQDSSFCLSPSQPSEIGYLNVASPGDTTASQLQEESQSISSENF